MSTKRPARVIVVEEEEEEEEGGAAFHVAKAAKTSGASPEAPVVLLPRAVCDKLDEEHVCVITQELPIDPVIAEDGFTYERSAIEGYFGATRTEVQARSPLTREAMGKELKPDLKLRSLFETLIGGGYWTSEKASTWMEKREEVAKDARKVEALKKSVRDGNSVRDCAWELAVAYHEGGLHLCENVDEAHKWYHIAADAGHITAAAHIGAAYARGTHGFPKCLALCHAYFMSAAINGSESGCYEIGKAYAKGLGGFPKNRDRALCWLKKMATCSEQDAHGCDRREKAKELMDNLEGRAEEV